MEDERMYLVLNSCGNPDHGQDPDLPALWAQDGKVVHVESYSEASRQCRDYIDQNGLGAGNWNGGEVYFQSCLIGTVSYNGRVWRPDGQEIVL